MKEITLGQREKIFALYWLQGNLKYTECEDTYTNWLEHWRLEGKGNPYLEVVSLSYITDEEAKEVAQLFNLGHLSGATKQLVLSLLESILSHKQAQTQFILQWLNVIDYLRSKGYALPAFGYSVDDLVQHGIFKLKTTKP